MQAAQPAQALATPRFCPAWRAEAAPRALTAAAYALGEATVTGDRSELDAILADMSPAEIVGFVRALDTHDSAFMAAVVAGEAWAPGGRMWQGAAGFRAKLDAERKQREERERKRPALPPDPRRRELARLAFAALRQRRPAVDMLLALHRHNAELSPPLPAAEINRIAIWCAERARENGNA